MKQVQPSISTSPASIMAAKLSFVTAGVFLVLLAALHFLKPEFNPTWHMISEYEIGRYGRLMQAAFLGVALSCVTLAWAMYSQVRTIAGRIGLTLLCLAAVGMTTSGINITDPIETPQAAMSAHGNLHGTGFAIGVPSLTIGIFLVTLSLRRNAAWAPVRKALWWFALLPWVSLFGMVAVLMTLLPQHGGQLGPGVIVGLPNRLYIITCAIWLMISSWHTSQLPNQRA